MRHRTAGVGRGFALSMGVSLGALSVMGCGSAVAQTSADAAPPASAAIATDSTSTLQEVVVTAQRRTQNLQDVPIAVTSFSAAALTKQQIFSTLDLGRVVPNMFASENVGQASANVYYIRGLGQTESFPTFEPQVGTYVDDIYIARQNANNFALFGVDQVQVLRGPQGTLFGRNSTGGAIVVTLQKPGSTFGGDVEIGYGAYDAFSGRAAIDLPISSEIRTRTSVYGLTDDGYVKDVTTGQKLNANHNYGVREAVLLLPKNLSNVEWNMAVDFQRNDGANVLNFPSATGGVNGSNRISDSGFSTDPGELSAYQTGAKGNLGQGVVVRSFGFESDLKAKFDVGTLDLISGFRGLSQATAVDFPDSALGPIIPYDQSPAGQFTLDQELRSYQYSQEVKFTGEVGPRFDYTTGAFYLFETNRDNYGAVANLAPLLGIPGLTSFPFSLGDEYTRNQTISEAVYAQGDLKITPKLSVTLGGRYTHEIKTVLATPNVPASGETPSSGFTTADIQADGYKTHLDANEFTPRVAVQYQFTPQIMAFASATRGFQGGGWNGLAFTANTYNNFGPETIWSYESGFRSETPDRKFRLNGTFFYENVNNYQLLSDLATAASFVTTNAASLEAYGAEFDATWKPIDHLTLDTNVGLIRALYFDANDTVRTQQAACAANPGAANASCGNGIVRLTGALSDPTYTPPLTVSGSAAYDFMFHGLTITPVLSAQYFARQSIGTASTPDGLDKARTLLDFGVTFKPDNMPVTVTAECKNCTANDYGITYLFGYRYYNVPTSWDVRVAYKF